MSFDIRTLAIIGASMCTVMSLLYGASARHFPQTERVSLRIWTHSLLLQPLAWGLFAARGVIPDFLSVVVGNALLILSLCESARALRRYLGCPQHRLLLWSIPLLVGAATWWYLAITPDFSRRVIAASLGASGVLVLMATPLWRSLRPGGSMPGRVICSLCVVGIVVLALRIVHHLRHPHPDGSLFDMRTIDAVGLAFASTAPVFFSLGFLLMQHERLYQQMHTLATTDTLTGVLARGALETLGRQLLHDCRAVGRPLSLLMIDVDHFKRINDLHGHAVGDEVLRRIVHRIRSQLRADDRIGRLGGEEFLVLLPGASGEQAQAVAGRVHQRVRERPVNHQSLSLPVTVSLGVIEAGPRELDWSVLLTRADHAMYRAKHDGRDRVVRVVDTDGAPA